MSKKGADYVIERGDGASKVIMDAEKNIIE